MMNMRRNSRRRRVKAEMNVVPYIDVMLVLLVIFMIAAPLINQAIEIDLPKAEAEQIDLTELEDTQPIVLSVDPQGAYFLNLAPNPAKALTDLEVIEITKYNLAKYPQTPVLVQGDSNVAYENVIAGISLLQEAGAPKVGLSTQPPEIAVETTSP